MTDRKARATPKALTKPDRAVDWVTTSNEVKRMRMRVLSCGLLCVAVSGWGQQTYQPGAGRTLIRAGHVIDVHTGNELPDETVIVQGDKIVGVAKTAETPAKAGDRVVDLAQYRVLPGMIDVHVHMTMVTDFDPYFEL